MLGRILGHFGPKHGQGFKPGPAAHSYPNIGLALPHLPRLPARASVLRYFCRRDASRVRSAVINKNNHTSPCHTWSAYQRKWPTCTVSKRQVSHNVLFRAGVCLCSRCGQSYFHIKWRSNNWRRGRQRKYRWAKLFIDTLFLIGCIVKATLRSVVSPMALWN